MKMPWKSRLWLALSILSGRNNLVAVEHSIHHAGDTIITLSFRDDVPAGVKW